MNKRKTPRTGTWADEAGKHWFRVAGRAAQGPFDSFEERDREYRNALNRRLVGSVRARGNKRFTRF